MGKLLKKFRSIQKLPTWFFWLPATLLKILRHTLFRVVLVDPNNYLETVHGAITVTWHNRLLFFPAVFPKEARKMTVAVVSASRDGQYVTDLISFFGLTAVRGSSRRGGANAQLGALHAIKAGKHVSFTPDGPRGPRYVMSRGPIQLASVTGAPVVPIAINASRCWSLRSWDGFQIPKPFSTLTLVIGAMVKVPPNITPEQLEEYRKIVEERLNLISLVTPEEQGGQRLHGGD